MEVMVSAKSKGRRLDQPSRNVELVKPAPETIEKLRLRVMNQIALHDHQFLFSVFPLWDQQKVDRE